MLLNHDATCQVLEKLATELVHFLDTILVETRKYSLLSRASSLVVTHSIQKRLELTSPKLVDLLREDLSIASQLLSVTTKDTSKVLGRTSGPLKVVVERDIRVINFLSVLLKKQSLDRENLLTGAQELLQLITSLL